MCRAPFASASMARTSAIQSAGTAQRSVVTRVFCDTFCAAFCRRTSADSVWARS